MDYAVHNVPSYQHLQGKVSPSHLGSKNSEAHSANDTSYAGMMAGSHNNAYESNPGGMSRIGRGSPTKNPQSDD